MIAAPSAFAQPLQRVRVALSTPTPHMAPLWVAKDRKFFEKYGLDVQLILVNSGSLVAQMFAAGELQITLTDAIDREVGRQRARAGEHVLDPAGRVFCHMNGDEQRRGQVGRECGGEPA